MGNNIHWNGYGKDHEHKGPGSFEISGTPDGFHTFGMYLGKYGYIFYVNGKEPWRVYGPVSDTKQFILRN